MAMDDSTRDRLLRRLAGIIGDRATTARAVLDHHGQSESHYDNMPPDIVAFPQDTDEVRQVVTLANDESVPIVPFGAGTSLEGNTAAVRGGICIDFGQMTRIIAISAADMTVTVQPGLTRKALNAALRDTGLFFPIDPGADASIGGMASTRASGTMAVRYGTMRENVLALEVVTASGRVIRTGTAARKSSAGYDLTHLFVGAEGTLGVITEVTLKLHPRPEAAVVAVCPFPTLDGAVAAATETMQSGVGVARIELLDDVMIRGINRHVGLGLGELPTLFLEFHGSPSGVREQSQTVEAIVRDHGAIDFRHASEQGAREQLWAARENTLYAGLGLRPRARALITDICVPVSRVGECLLETRDDIDRSGFLAPIVGHVGDGNFHALILVDPADPQEIAAAKALHARMIERALALGGTSTGEHGIGIGKRPFLRSEHGDAVDLMQTIKHALDPRGIMNPGKIFEVTEAG